MNKVNSGSNNLEIRACIYCDEPIRKHALICKECGRTQDPRWVAKLQASWKMGFVRAVMAGVVVTFGFYAYSAYSSWDAAKRDRIRGIVHSGLDIQNMADKLRQPCIGSDAECQKQFSELSGKFSDAHYKFKDQAKYLLSNDDGIKSAIAFIDDFYNPGRPGPKGIPLSELTAVPLQESILRSRDVQVTPFNDASWCGLPTFQ